MLRRHLSRYPQSLLGRRRFLSTFNQEPASTGPLSPAPQPAAPPTHVAILQERRPGVSCIVDSLSYIKELERAGFTREQSERLVRTAYTVIQECIQQLEQDLMLKQDQEKIHSMNRVDYAELRAEIRSLERNDFAVLKAENERMRSEVQKLQQKMRDDINRLHAQTRLDINLEKGRLWDDQSLVQAKLREIESRMIQDLSGVKASMDHVKFDTLRTLLTTASTVGVIILGYMRLFK